MSAPEIIDASAPTSPVFKRAQRKPISLDAFERSFEAVLWQCRLIVLIPVLASMLIGLAMFWVATVDTIENMSSVLGYSGPSPLPEVHEQMRSDLIAHVVEAIDGYLLGVVMIIFSMGLYELFISRISPAERSDRARGILVVHSLDDLKARLGQVILLMMIVKFFERALWLQYQNATDLTLLAIGIVLTSGALYLTHKGDHKQHEG